MVRLMPNVADEGVHLQRYLCAAQHVVNFAQK